MLDDIILRWNAIALEANRVNHTNMQENQETGPTRSSRALAIVHLAMYDAFAKVDAVVNPGANNLPPYLPLPAAPGAGATIDDAVAAAAYTTLYELFPSQRAAFELAFGGQPDPGNAGHAFGVAVGQAMITDRMGDPMASNPGYVANEGRGHHRVDPLNPGQGFHGAVYGKAKGFSITKRFQLADPPLGNAEYDTALQQVRRLGIAPELASTLPAGQVPRTPTETLIGLYWAYDGVPELGTPPRLYNQIIRKIAKAKANSTPQNAALFAFVNAAMADAGILAWDEKYRHDLWRPVVGIREHDPSMGPMPLQPGSNLHAECDPFWEPLGGPNTNRIAKNFTPPFPAYPSGHATFGAAALHITRLFYGVGGFFHNQTIGPDNLFQNMSFVSDELNGRNRDNNGTVRPRHEREFADGLLTMIQENGLSRVYLGVHWIFDAFVVQAGTQTNADLYRQDFAGNYFGGVPLGLQIAEDIFFDGPGNPRLGPRKSPVPPKP
jgi:hypothetical protein